MGLSLFVEPQSRAHNLFQTLHGLGMSMKAAGAKISLPEGMAALETGLDRDASLTV
jgi:alanine-glyoxylate transaminase/serine-glyoxylate transaminase/serine-pyruvate transaminase